MSSITVEVKRTRQYGEAVTVTYGESLTMTTFHLDGRFSHGDPLPNYFGGVYEASDADRQRVMDAVARCAETGESEALVFGAGEPVEVIEATTEPAPLTEREQEAVRRYGTSEAAWEAEDEEAWGVLRRVGR